MFAERRFAKPDGYGVLFTNGTGTGKTYTGLGVIYRMARQQGKRNILIVAPGDKVIDDWIHRGSQLGLTIERLADTKDAGRGINITTYENLGQNDALAMRAWDLVVADEAHKLMQSEGKNETVFLQGLRAITLHPRGIHERASRLHRDILQELSTIEGKLQELRAEARKAYGEEFQKLANEINKLEPAQKRAAEKWQLALEAVTNDVMNRQGPPRTRTVFLSATPFAYREGVDWAEGYLFNYSDGATGADNRNAYNTGSHRDQFFMRHFGYRMRYNKLAKPDAKVNTGLTERTFNGWLRKQGVLSTRALDVPFDYDRRFILIDSAIGQKIDEALAWLGDRDHPERRPLQALVNDQFDYNARTALLERIKAEAVVPLIKEHLALGRKVVVFHERRTSKYGQNDPFSLGIAPGTMVSVQTGGKATQVDLYQIYQQFKQAFPELFSAGFRNMPLPVAALTQAFPTAAVYNGDAKSKRERIRGIERFNTDKSGTDVVVIQTAAGKEGISAHDTTGVHQRALFNLGLPVAPVTAIQQEGRIYRVGQASDAMFRYLNTGTNWERWAFADKIASRVGTAENLSQGEAARGLKDAFIIAFEEAGRFPAGYPGEGTGGKAADRALVDAITPFERAKSFYWATKKKAQQDKAREGVDYFPTPEPLGFKMAEWLYLQPDERALEPSAGHGAIARWFPEHTTNVAIEPSLELASRLAMSFDGGKVINDTFESLDIVNKYNGIAMNPPYGTAGKTAMEHVAKAFKHLAVGGRMIAIIPDGPAMAKRFDDWLYGEQEKAATPKFKHDKLGDLYQGDVVRVMRFGTSVNATVLRASRDGDLVMVKIPGTPGDVGVPPASIRDIISTGPRTIKVKEAADAFVVREVKLPGVTFERAATQVRTRLVVIDKLPANTMGEARGPIDLSAIEHINELFDRIENLDMPRRPIVQPAQPTQVADSTVDKPVAPASASAPSTPAKPAPTLESWEQKHSRTGATQYMANMTRVVPREEYDRINALAKKHTGYWSRYENKADGIRKGFAFGRADDRDSFVREATGGTVESRLPRGAGMSAPQVQQIADDFVRKFPGARALKITVVNHVTEIPEAHRPSKYAAGAYHAQSGNVYLVAWNIASPDVAQQVLLHEIIGHYGVEALLGEQFDKVLERVQQIAHATGEVTGDEVPGDPNYPTMESVAKLYGDRPKREQAQEVLARMAETNSRATLLEAIYMQIRAALRKLGINLKLTNDDLRNLVIKAAQRLRDAPALSASERAVVADALSRRNDQATVHRLFDGGRIHPAESRQSNANGIRTIDSILADRGKLVEAARSISTADPTEADVERTRRQLLAWKRVLGSSPSSAGYGSDQERRTRGARGSASRNDNSALESRRSPIADEARAAEARLQIRAGRRERATRFMHRVEDLVEPLMTLPQRESFLKSRYLALGKIAQAEEMVEGLSAIFRGASDESKQQAYDYLTTAEADAGSIADAKVREKAVWAKGQINKIGDELVDRGLLDPESRETYRDAYLPRLYLKHMLSQDDWIALGAGKKPSKMGYLKERTDIPEEVRRIILGEITDPGFLAAHAISKPLRDMALLDWLESISRNEAWVLPQSFVQWRGKRVSAAWLASEAARIRVQSDFYKPEDAKIALDLANEMDRIARAALNDPPGDVARDYKKLPNTPRYGRMRGIWVRNEIYDDLMGVADFLPANQTIIGSLFGAGGAGTKLTQWWKMGKVALNLPAQIRNWASNAVLLQLSGVPLHRVPDRIVQAWREVANNGRYYQIAKKYGVTEATFTSNELAKVNRDLLDIERRMGRISVWGRLKLAISPVTNFAGDVYQKAEALFKTAKIIDAMERENMSEGDAALEAHKWMFDYSLVSPEVRYARNAPIGMPFLTFTAKVLPRLIEVAAKHPQRFLPWVGLFASLPLLVSAMTGADGDDLDRLRLSLPQWLRQRGHLAILPFRDEDGRWQVADVGYFLPWSFYTDMIPLSMATVRHTFAGDLAGAAQSLKDDWASTSIMATLMGLVGGPIPDIGVALKTNKDAFTGRDIVPAGATPGQKLAYMLSYAWDLMMPPMISSRGLASPFWMVDRELGGKAAQAINKDTTRYGEPRATPTQAGLYMAGVNLYGIDPDITRTSNLLQMRREIDDARRLMVQKLSNRSLSDEERRAIIDRANGEIKRRLEKLQDYATRSAVPASMRTERKPETVQ